MLLRHKRGFNFKVLWWVSINQSIKIYFLSNRNITVCQCIQCMLALKRMPEKHTLMAIYCLYVCLLKYLECCTADLTQFLASSANLPTGLYILPSVIFSFSFFLNMSKSISGFWYVKGRCHGNSLILVKCHERRLIPLAFFALLLENELHFH